MKAFVMIEKEVEIKEVIIDISPRYIGDSKDDDMPTDFPLLNDAKNSWVARVNIDTGIIANWPQGNRHRTERQLLQASDHQPRTRCNTF